MKSRRVVVTGMGVISPVGLTVQQSWRALITGCSGIRPISLFDPGGFGVRIAGEAHGFDPVNYMPAKEARRMDRFTQFAMAALEQALEQSGLVVQEHDPYQVGAIIGSGVGGIWTYTAELEVLHAKGPHRVSPFLIPSITVDVPAVQVALRTGAQGLNLGVSSACATSADAVGQAFAAIRRGDCLAMFAGGFEAAVTPVGVAAFDRMHALSHRNNNPQAASRPFDRGRDGFVLAEGGGLLVLEELDFALRRGAPPLAEILAYAATSDAVHLAAPDAAGLGASQSMRLAIQRAGAAPEEVTYLNAHGTSTQAGDIAETRAIRTALGSHSYCIPVSSTKSMTGHMLGGAGAFEAVVCIQALSSGIIPPTINLDEPDPDCDLDFVPHQARRASLGLVLSNSMGFGGHNVTLAFKPYRLG